MHRPPPNLPYCASSCFAFAQSESEPEPEPEPEPEIEEEKDDVANAGQGSGPPLEQVIAIFRSIDLNEDGKVSKEELASNTTPAAPFHAAHLNNAEKGHVL